MSHALLRTLQAALLVVSSGVVAHTSASASADPTSTRMLAALDSVQADKLKIDVAFIASDEREGRDTPSEGLRVTARYLRSRLERLGWTPAGRDGFFHTYPLEQRTLDMEQSKALVTSGDKPPLELAYGKDAFVISTGDNVEHELTGGIVSIGGGSKQEIEGVTLEGKWALCIESADAGDEDTDDVSDIARRLRKKKALGLVFGPAPDSKGKSVTERFAAGIEFAKKGTVKPIRKEPEAKPASEPERERVPRLVLTRESVQRLFEAAALTKAPKAGTKLALELSDKRKLLADGGRVEVENVCGLWPGSDPELKHEVVIVSAHYDHVGVQSGVVYNGADDNGSGTSGLLSIAEALTQFGPLRRSVMLIWVSGEEKGLWGSRAWVEDPSLPEGYKAIANINIDMIGRNAPDKLLITPTRKREKEYNGLVKLTEKLAPLEGFPELGSADQYYHRSDQINFAKLDIPVMFLFSDVHADYHQPGDDPEKLDYDKIRRVSRLVLRILDAIQVDEPKLR